jgi:integrase/recombinase XerD
LLEEVIFLFFSNTLKAPRLTTHIARKTFASTVLLFNNVPMEVVSCLLGHSKMQTTQESYGKVVEKRISLEINKLKGK